MSLPESDYQILKLTDVFYREYPNPLYNEILKKNNRAYNCLLFQSHYCFMNLHILQSCYLDQILGK